MLSRVRSTMARYGMVVPGQHIGVAVSGGADSVCLLHVLQRLAAECGIALTVLHLNHRLRGEDSDADEQFVRTLAERLGLPAVCESADGLRGTSGNLEQAAREARRRFFGRMRAEGVVDRVATGHTRSDQAETLLQRLLRGAGTAGLGGILPVTAEGVIRPLLDCARAEVEDFLLAENLPWREDATNADNSFLRNRIRHELLPLIERDYSPAITSILSATASVARSEERYWAAEMTSLSARFVRRAGDAVILEAPVLAGLHEAVARRLVRSAICLVKGDLRGIDLSHVDQVLDLAIRNEGHGRTQVPCVDAMRSFEWLRLAPPRGGSRQDRDYAFALTGPFPRRVELPGGPAIYLELLDQIPDLKRYNEQIGAIDWDAPVVPLELRNWHPGDTFEAAGKSSVKIKSLFQEYRIPLWDRQGWPVIVAGSTVVWARRFGVAGPWMPKATTRCILRVYDSGEVRTGHGTDL